MSDTFHSHPNHRDQILLLRFVTFIGRRLILPMSLFDSSLAQNPFHRWLPLSCSSILAELSGSLICQFHTGLHLEASFLHQAFHSSWHSYIEGIEREGQTERMTTGRTIRILRFRPRTLPGLSEKHHFCSRLKPERVPACND
jgi:hypothetical protein